jgi:hypothetical protein
MRVPKWLLLVFGLLILWFFYDGYVMAKAAQQKTGGVGPL